MYANNALAQSQQGTEFVVVQMKQGAHPSVPGSPEDLCLVPSAWCVHPVLACKP